MFRHVIVGVDGRPAGRDAIALARVLAAAQSRPTLAHVNHLTPAGVVSYAFGDSEPALDAQQMLERERDATGIDAELVSLHDSSVGRGLHTVAERRAADLLVVGSCHRGFAGRVLAGNDTRAALNGATCAVAVAPTGYADDGAAIRRIGVGYDGQPQGAAALSLARELAASHGAEVHVLEVVEIPNAPYGWVGAGVVLADRIAALLAEATARMAALEGVQGRALFGFAGEELAAFGATVDLLIVGSRDYGPVRRLVPGSTATYLAGHGRCPLLVLPRAVVDDAREHAPLARDRPAPVI